VKFVKSTWRNVVLAIGVLIGVGLLATLALREPSLPDFAAAGPVQSVPAETMAVVSGRDLQNIIAGLEGQPVVVNIWGSWCPPCRAEMPLLQRVAESYEGEAVLLGVAVRDDPKVAARFLQDFAITYPNLYDPSGDVLRALEVRVFPTTYVFDANGVIVSRVDGGVSEQRIVGMIEDALRESES